MFETLKAKAIAFHESFHQSGTIVFARLHVFVGIILGVLTTTDLSPWLPPKYLTLWLILSGIAMEYIRKSRSEVDEQGRLTPRDDNRK
jgi:hypothetical protein